MGPPHDGPARLETADPCALRPSWSSGTHSRRVLESQPVLKELTPRKGFVIVDEARPSLPPPRRAGQREALESVQPVRPPTSGSGLPLPHGTSHLWRAAGQSEGSSGAVSAGSGQAHRSAGLERMPSLVKGSVLWEEKLWQLHSRWSGPGARTLVPRVDGPGACAPGSGIGGGDTAPETMKP